MAGGEAFVVGGANSAGQAALHLAEYARRVTLVVRADSLEAGMSHYLVRQVEARPTSRCGWAPRSSAAGGDGLAGAARPPRPRTDGATETVAADALFLMIGAARTPTGCRLRSRGTPAGSSAPARMSRRRGLAARARARSPSRPACPGVFAAGDVRHGSMSRVASAVGEGSIAIRLVHELFAAEPS